MNNWYMLTVVGKDRPGIVAHVTTALYQGDCHLGEASMMRLGGNFTIMLMVQYQGNVKALQQILEPVGESLGLHMHVDRIEAKLHSHVLPDVRISVYGADRPGIVSQVTSALTQGGLNILDLESDVAGSADKPIYIMHIEGLATEGIEVLQSALDIICREGIDAKLSLIDTVIG